MCMVLRYHCNQSEERCVVWGDDGGWGVCECDVIYRLRLNQSAH